AAVRAAAELDARAVSRGNQIRPSAKVLFEQPAQTARLRHRETARLRARAARHIGDRARLRQAEARCGEPAIQLTHIAGIDPPDHEILIRRDAHGAVAVRARQIAEYSHLGARQIAERNAGDRHHESELFLTPYIR